MIPALASLVIGLTGMLCANLARRHTMHARGAYYWLAALLSLPGGLAVGLWYSFTPIGLAALLAVIGAGYWALSHYSHAYFTPSWRNILAGVTGLLPLAAAYFARDEPTSLVLCLLAAVLISAELGLRFRVAWFALVSLAAALLVPLVLGQGAVDPPLTTAGQAWSYAAVAVFLVLWRFQLRGLGESFEAVGVVGYLLAVLTALGFAIVSGPATVFAVGLVLAGGLFLLSYGESLPEVFVYVATAVAGYALIQVTDVYGWALSTNAVILGGLGALVYLSGWRSEHPARSRALRYAGICMAYVGVYPGLLVKVPPLGPVFALATAGVLLWFEARRQGRITLAEVSGAILVLAFDWLMLHYGHTQAQWYTLPVAGYFMYLAVRRRQLGHDAYDVFAVAALAFLTFPTAIQALTTDTWAYSLILIFEALTLVTVGSAIGYKLVIRWGSITLLAALCYQIPKLILPLLGAIP